MAKPANPKSSKSNAPNPANAQPGDVRGASGTIIFNGFIVKEEYNQDLVGKKGLDLYDQMRKSDATVRAALNIVKLPIMSASWRVQSSSDDAKDQTIADFVAYNLFELWPFEDFLRQALTMLEFGFSVFEIVWDVIDFEGKQYLGIQQLANRKQSTIWQWALDDGTFGVKQFVPGGVDGGFKQIPGDKILVFSNEREGENYAGVSILRSAYKHWYFKDALYKIDGIAAERNGVGLPIVYVPPDAKAADIAMVEELARNTRANEQGFIRVPEGFVFEFADFKTKQNKDLSPMINHHDRQIMKTVLAQFLELGSADASGSYNLSEDQSRLFIQSIQWVAKYFAEVINQDLIPKLVDLNFGPTDNYPELEFEKIGDDNLAELATNLPLLAGAGFITATPEDEEHIRKIAGLPDIPDSAMNDEENVNLPTDPEVTDVPNNTPKDTGTGTKPTALPTKRSEALRKDRARRDVLLSKILQAADNASRNKAA